MTWDMGKWISISNVVFSYVFARGIRQPRINSVHCKYDKIPGGFVWRWRGKTENKLRTSQPGSGDDVG